MEIHAEPITEKWYLSKLNFLPEVTGAYHFSPEIILSDCTLRDGEQQAGIVFTKEDKIAIAKQLDTLGVHEIEIGMPAASREDTEAAQAILSLGLGAKITALARATEKDIDLLAGLGVYGAMISLPIGDLQRKFKLKWDDQKYLDTCFRITEYAKNKGLYVNLSPYDTTRVDLEFFDMFLEKVAKSGLIDRMRLVDTVGSASPGAIRYLVGRMKSALGDIPIEIHCHNDFGLAVAATIAGVEAGAGVISSTINGLGERSGNAATEEVVMALRLLYGLDLGIDLVHLKETSELVETLSGVALQRHKPVVGRNCFSHESGMVVSGWLNMRFTSEAYAPEIVGQKSSLVIGKKSGKASIEHKLKEHGLFPSEAALEQIVEKVKAFAVSRKRALSDEELLQIAKTVETA